jgi:hypothetical protein
MGVQLEATQGVLHCIEVVVQRAVDEMLGRDAKRGTRPRDSRSILNGHDDSFGLTIDRWNIAPLWGKAASDLELRPRAA